MSEARELAEQKFNIDVESQKLLGLAGCEMKEAVC